MLFAAHQPHYLPWLRYLHKVAAADVFVLLDDVQYTKNGWQNRTRIKGPRGAVLLTVPVHARLGARIFDVRPASQRWRRRHLAALDACYGAGLGGLRDRTDAAFELAEASTLATLGELTLVVLLDAFGIRTPVVRSSGLGVGGRGSERLAEIGRCLGANAYLTGAHALDAYLDPDAFRAAGIDVAVQAWECPRYVQRFGDAGFVPDLSAIDLLVNEPARAPEILAAGGEVVPSDRALAAHTRS